MMLIKAFLTYFIYRPLISFPKEQLKKTRITPQSELQKLTGRIHAIMRSIWQLEKTFTPPVEHEYRAARWRNDLIICLVSVGLIILIQFVDFHSNMTLHMYYSRMHYSTGLMWIRFLSLGRMGFVLCSALFGAWLLWMLVKPKPLYQKYDRYLFIWIMLLTGITSCNGFISPRWYPLSVVSHIPALLLFYLIIPQHNFWLRIFPGLSFTVVQIILYAFFKTPPPLFGFTGVYSGYILSNIIGIIYSHRLYMHERRNFALHRKKDRVTALLKEDKQKLQQEKELVAHYEAELRKQEVRREKLKALQAQIKPHFLFNSLSTIAFYCRTDSGKAYQLVNNLSTFLQSTFTLQSQTVLWEDERQLVRAYLAIESARMEERLHFSIEETGDLSACHIPPLTIQPLVENAIRHGLAPLPGGGALKITAREMPDHYFFEVKDNGRGFNPTPPANTIPHEAKASGGIGLPNIEDRLQGLYGSGLKINSLPGEGTGVSFRIPKDPS